MNFINAYMEAFQRCYPQTKLAVHRARQRGHGDTPRWHVVINGDKGDITLSEDDLKAASRAFQR